ncbi:hypothetical protein [Embleya hyalina]|nr:hypothetical protein [Embleya hyalina]
MPPVDVVDEWPIDRLVGRAPAQSLDPVGEGGLLRQPAERILEGGPAAM